MKTQIHKLSTVVLLVTGLFVSSSANCMKKQMQIKPLDLGNTQSKFVLTDLAERAFGGLTKFAQTVGAKGLMAAVALYNLPGVKTYCDKCVRRGAANCDCCTYFKAEDDWDCYETGTSCNDYAGCQKAVQASEAHWTEYAKAAGIIAIPASICVVAGYKGAKECLKKRRPQQIDLREVIIENQNAIRSAQKENTQLMTEIQLLREQEDESENNSVLAAILQMQQQNEETETETEEETEESGEE